MMKIGVTTTREAEEKLICRAENVSEELRIPYIKRGNQSIDKIFSGGNFDYLLVVEKNRLVINGEDCILFWHPNMSELKIKSLKNGNKEAILEAVQLNRGDSILDCTLGLGGDSLVFSAVVGPKGCVIGIEVNKYIAYITKNGLQTYKDNAGNTLDYMKRIKVINDSYENYLKIQEDNSFDVVYFDPMFKKPNKKSTSVNSFRAFADHRKLTEETLKEALRVCRKRVVIKERYGENDLEKLGVKKFYGSSRKGAIIYGVIDKVF